MKKINLWGLKEVLSEKEMKHVLGGSGDGTGSGTGTGSPPNRPCWCVTCSLLDGYIAKVYVLTGIDYPNCEAAYSVCAEPISCCGTYCY